VALYLLSRGSKGATGVLMAGIRAGDQSAVAAALATNEPDATALAAASALAERQGKTIDRISGSWGQQKVPYQTWAGDSHPRHRRGQPPAASQRTGAVAGARAAEGVSVGLPANPDASAPVACPGCRSTRAQTGDGAQNTRARRRAGAAAPAPGAPGEPPPAAPGVAGSAPSPCPPPAAPAVAAARHSARWTTCCRSRQRARRSVRVGLTIFGGAAANSGDRHTHRLGRRIAQRTPNGDLARDVVVLLGVASGLMAAHAVTRVLSGFLFGVGAHDPTAFLHPALLAGQHAGSERRHRRGAARVADRRRAVTRSAGGARRAGFAYGRAVERSRALDILSRLEELSARQYVVAVLRGRRAPRVGERRADVSVARARVRRAIGLDGATERRTLDGATRRRAALHATAPAHRPPAVTAPRRR
jgi:hypothetical protein